MQRKASIPAIRFAGFSDDWEQHKFSEITYPAGEKNRDNLPLESYSITNEAGFVPQNEKFENGGTMQEADKRMYYIVSPQSFAYNPARINVGSIGYQNLDKSVIVSSLYEVFKTTDIVDDRFLWHWFKSNDFQKLIEQFQEGGVRLYFYYDKLCKGTISLPSKDEQQRKGKFLDHLDHLITLYQHKHTRLCNIKKSMLEKMLPKEGAVVPKIRFAGFTGDWEQHKLGDVSHSFEYGLNAAATTFDGKNKYIRITDIDDETRLFLMSDLTSPDIDLRIAENHRLQEGDIVFARTGASVGKTYIYKPSDGVMYYAGFLIRARIKPEYYANFIFQNTLTEQYKRFINVTSQRSGQPGVNAQEYSTFEFPVPEYAEQQQIGNFFQNLDNLITLYQRELERLQTIKKACLEKMFV